MESRQPTLTLTYLPHLDYNLQRLGPDLDHPDIQKDLGEVDELCGELIEEANRTGQEVMVVSEYGITPVTDAVHINRALRASGFIAVRNEQGREQLDAGASQAFAVADHQIAHVYVNNTDRLDEVRTLLESLDGVDQVLDEAGKKAFGLDHERSGELVAISTPDRWFSYYYWLDDAKAPDYSNTVDIHRKPGYDPVELFVDPEIKSAPVAIGTRLAKKKLGFRTLMDVISNKDTALVKGSHGRITDDPDHGPILISSNESLLPESPHQTDIKDIILKHVFGENRLT